MDWLDLLAVQGTLKSLLQHHSSKVSILWCSVFFMVQLSHPYMTTGKTTVLTRQTFVCKVMSLFFNMLFSFVIITFLPRSKHLLISWLQSPSAVTLEPPQNKVCHCFYCFPIMFPMFPHNVLSFQIVPLLRAHSFHTQHFLPKLDIYLTHYRHCIPTCLSTCWAHAYSSLRRLWLASRVLQGQSSCERC